MEKSLSRSRRKERLRDLVLWGGGSEELSDDSDDGVNDVDDHRTNISFDLPDPHMGGEIGPVVHSDIQIKEDGETDSYEELVARKVNQYLSQTRNFLMNTDMARKVAAWHKMIGPKLELIEKNKHFDIHAYGTDLQQ